MNIQTKLIALTAAGIGICAPVMAQQASITLLNSDVAYCYKQDTPWTIAKTNNQTGTVAPGTPVNWTITATKGTPGPRQLCVNGVVTVSNTGTATATIGNIVVDIQRSTTGQNKWKALSADMADATNGDAASTDQVLSAALASQTDYSMVTGGPAPTGAFKFGENLASGTLEFTDASSNTVWAISPAQTIPVGNSVTLYFKAMFNAENIVPALNPGESLRTEVLVSFGNSGARGGSGASGSGIDINGNGVNTDPEEKNVRTVPTRLTYPVPALQKCNDWVAVTDTFSNTPNASVSDVTLDAALGTMINVSTIFTVTGTVNGSGTVTNTANLDGTDTTVSTAVVPNTFPCCVAIHTSDTSSVTVGSAPVVTGTAYCSYSRNEFLHNGAGNPILLSNFSTAFTTNVPFSGHPACPTSGACTKNGLTIGSAAGNYHATWDSESAFETAIGGGGPNGTLTANLFNATSVSAGKFPKNVAALVLNVKMSGISPSIGNLVYNNPGDFFDGKTVSQILDAANATLATGVLPSITYDLNKFDGLIDQINQSWNKCKPNALVNQGALVEAK